ncbi:MAG: CpaF family protein, partial [Saprospiraceae bacterium]|nr:CpaF family protein [Saprospiraceae bacterium]
MSRLKELLQQRVLEDFDLSKEVTDDELLDTIDRLLIDYSKEEYITMEEKQRIRREIFNSIRRLDILQELIEDPNITEIMV